MGFETVVLSVVRDVCRHANAGFEYGTLFIDNISKEEADRILNNLQDRYKCGVEMNKVGQEFAFDFI